MQKRSTGIAFVLGLLWCAVTLAQPPASLETHRFLRDLGAILAESTATGGVVVVGIPDGSPALYAGLQPLDTLLEVGSRPITRIADVVDALAPVAPGESIEIVVRRGEQQQALRLFPGFVAETRKHLLK